MLKLSFISTRSWYKFMNLDLCVYCDWEFWNCLRVYFKTTQMFLPFPPPSVLIFKRIKSILQTQKTLRTISSLLKKVSKRLTTKTATSVLRRSYEIKNPKLACQARYHTSKSYLFRRAVLAIKSFVFFLIGSKYYIYITEIWEHFTAVATHFLEIILPFLIMGT